MCDQGEGVTMGVENGSPSIGHAVFLRRDVVGRQSLTLSIKYNNKHFQLEPDVCEYKDELLIISQRMVWGNRCDVKP